MLARFFVLTLFTFIVSCQRKNEVKTTTFDWDKWTVKEGKNYLYRKDMLDDLVYNYKWHGLPSDSIYKRLGKPDRSENLHLYYTVYQKFLGDHLPVHTTTLVIKLKPDSTVEWRKIHR